jgi:predicted NAD/FAD-binding protein
MKLIRLLGSKNGVQIYYGSDSEFFNYDKVVLASHADESLKIISDTTNEEKEILSNFKYKPNKAFIHSDESAMPKNKKAWCSWNSSLNPKEY